MILGQIDSITTTVIGWAVDTDNPQGCVVDIYIDGSLHASYVVGNENRDDVKESLAERICLEDSRCGFNIDLKGALSEAGSRIEVRYNKTGELIPGSNGIIVCPPLAKKAVAHGAGGYKFFIGEKSEVIDLLVGNIEPDKADIKLWSHRYCVIDAAVKAHGGKFLPVIVPEKISIAPKLLSRDIVLSDNRLSISIINECKNVFDIDVLYPIEDLLEKESLLKVITRSDSHLSWRSHHIIFEILLSKLEISELSPTVEWVESEYIHDLSTWDGTKVAETEAMPWFKSSGEIIPIHSRGTNTKVFVNIRGYIDLVVLFGHSSCKVLSSYIRQVAKVTVVISSKSISQDLILKFKPDVVVSYLAERNLVNAGSDILSELSSMDFAMISRGLNISRRFAATKDLHEPILGAHINDGALLNGWPSTAVKEAKLIAKGSTEQIQMK